MADNSTIIRLDIIKYNPIGIEKNACFATNLLYYCGRVGVKGSLFNIPQMLPMKKQKYLVENGMRQGYIKGRQGETGS